MRDPSSWDKQTFYNTTFGQGISVTVPQLAGAYQTIANGGVRMPLSLVEGCTAADGTVTDVPDVQGTRVVSEDAARTVSQMLENVATQGTLSKQVAIPGTASPSRREPVRRRTPSPVPTRATRTSPR